jgi:hypothetical protein
MTREEVEQVLVEKPFASPAPPPINWELVKKLTTNINQEQLSKFLSLAYNRGIP